jgi:O-antigen/teichoic acid export membrane protein
MEAMIGTKSLIRSGIGVASLTGLELALGLLAAIVLARAIGAEGLGTYTLVLAVVVLTGLLVEFGLPSLVIREIAHHDSIAEVAVVKGILLYSLLVIILMSAIVIPLVISVGPHLVPGITADEPQLLPIAAALIPLSALSTTIGAALSGKQLVVLGMVPQRFIRPATFTIALIAASTLEPGWLTPFRAVVLQVMAATAALSVSVVQLIRHFSSALRQVETQIAWRAWSLAMLRLGLTNGIRLAEGQILLLVTGALASAETVGFLRVAQRGAGLVALGTSIAVSVASPRIARLNADGQLAHLQRLLTLVARASIGVAIMGFLVFAFGGGHLLEILFGVEFIPAWSALVILSAAEISRAIFGLGGVLLNMLRYENVTMVGLLLSLAVSSSTAIMLTPHYGAVGAAWGMFLGVTAVSALLRYMVKRTLNLETSVIGGR